MKSVLIIATLDTKGEEAEYIRQAVERHGLRTVLLDPGMRGDQGAFRADIRREQVASAGGSDYAHLQEMSHLQSERVMITGVAKIVGELYSRQEFDGVIGIGGSDGTLLATAGMRVLPFGVPKVMVSASACGAIQFGDYVGTSDVMVLPSVADFLGINEITCKTLDNAVGAIVGMVNADVTPAITSKNLVAITMYGQTTPAGSAGKRLLERAGFRAVAFHPNGVGGKAMEEFIGKGVFVGVWDLTTQELSDQYVMRRPSGGPTRLEEAGKRGLPQVVVPGCTDFVWGKPEVMRERFPERLTYQFNPQVLLVKLTMDEIAVVARNMAEKLNRAAGPVALVLPLGGVSMFDADGGPLHDSGINDTLFSTLKSRVKSPVELTEVQAHINDPVFAQVCASRLVEMLNQVVRE